MLDAAAAHNVRMDTVQMPLNVMDAHFRSFEKKVLPRLVRDEIGVLGMKPLASGKILQSGAANAVECLQYAMNLPTSTVITGIESKANLDQAIRAATSFEKLSEGTVVDILARTAELADEGKFERFKTTTEYDGTVQNPEWLG